MMRKLIYILALVVLAGCSRQETTLLQPDTGVVLSLTAGGHQTRIVDADNLPSEQYIANVSVFLTEPGGLNITHTFIHPPITTVGDTTKITLSAEPAKLQARDIYIVTNHDDQAMLGALTTVAELRAARTPQVDAGNNLDPEQGICMYGRLSGFDFTDPGTYPAVVTIERTCSKYRVRLTFPDSPGISTDNSFLIRNAPRFTFIGGIRAGNTAVDSYYDYSESLPLEYDETQQAFINNTYLYEAFAVPVIDLYIHVDGQEQVYSAKLPIPEHNYLFDIYVEIYFTPFTATQSSPQIHMTVEKTVLSEAPVF